MSCRINIKNECPHDSSGHIHPAVPDGTYYISEIEVTNGDITSLTTHRDASGNIFEGSGASSSGTTTNGIVIGTNSTVVDSADSTVIGPESDCNAAIKCIVAGSNISCNVPRSVCIGNHATCINADMVSEKMVSIGDFAAANATRSVAIGDGAQVDTLGDRGVAIGTNSNANATQAISVGYNSESSCPQSTAVGPAATCLGTAGFETALGNEAYTNGEYAVAAGSEAEARGEGSITVGSLSKAIGTVSGGALTLGYNSTCTALIVRRSEKTIISVLLVPSDLYRRLSATT